MGVFYDTYKKVKKEIATNPRKCAICGCTETMDNLMLMYDNGKIMCDDCMLEYYKDEPIFEVTDGQT